MPSDTLITHQFKCNFFKFRGEPPGPPFCLGGPMEWYRRPPGVPLQLQYFLIQKLSPGLNYCYLRVSGKDG